MSKSNSSAASSGHQLGQLVGDWFEDYFASPLLRQVAESLRLYLDHRRRSRECRGEKVLWEDEDGNSVAFDFVMELDGSEREIGVPVAFFETFWRRGSRHSKDKARDDGGKLMPMKEAYPTAQFAGIVAGGDFTQPAIQLVKSRGIDLLLIPKAKVLAAFSGRGFTIDYPDKLPESEKALLVAEFQSRLDHSSKEEVASDLRNLIGEASLKSYISRVKGSLGSLPQEIRISARKTASPAAFETVEEATQFLKNPQFGFDESIQDFVYQITFVDGREFERSIATLDDLRALHAQTERLAKHVATLD